MSNVTTRKTLSIKVTWPSWCHWSTSFCEDYPKCLFWFDARKFKKQRWLVFPQQNQGRFTLEGLTSHNLIINFCDFYLFKCICWNNVQRISVYVITFYWNGMLCFKPRFSRFRFYQIQKPPTEVFYEKGILKNFLIIFVILTGKQFCWSFFWIK